MVDGIELNEDIAILSASGRKWEWSFSISISSSSDRSTELYPGTDLGTQDAKKEAEALALHYLERVRIAEQPRSFPDRFLVVSSNALP